MLECENKLLEAAKGIIEDIGKDNKAARRRVRRYTLVIAKEGKAYRKASLEKDKA